MEEVTYLIVLLLLSAFFSGSEIALMSLADFKIRYLQDKGYKGAKALAKIRKNKQNLLITILIGNNIVNIAASAMATKVAMNRFDDHGVSIAIGLMTFLILMFGEIMPKAFASVHVSKTALIIAPIFKVLMFVFAPLVYIFNFFTVVTRRSMGASKNPKITEEEISILVDYGQQEGAIKSAEREMIQNIFKFDDIAVKEVMTPRTDMILVESSRTVQDVIVEFVKHGYSRLPVYKDTFDQIIGVLLVKDIMDMIYQGKTDVAVETITKPAYFVPQTMSIDNLFRELQKEKIHIAIIVDEYGGLSGLVTLEDLLEEIVGEIFDETDKIDLQIRKVSANTWLVKGGTDIDDINKELEVNIPSNKNFVTISGYILDIAKKIPSVDEVFEDELATYTITKTLRNRIAVVKVTKK